MKAATEPLIEYKVRGKFWAMKLTVVAASFIEVIIVYLPWSQEYSHYNQDTISSAWAATVACFLMIPLAWLIRRSFGIEDCILPSPVFVSADLTHKSMVIDGYGSLHCFPATFKTTDEDNKNLSSEK